MSVNSLKNNIYNDSEGLSKAVVFSLALHIALVSFFIFKASFYVDENSIYESAIRVDLVGLPDKIDPNKNLLPAPEDKKETKSAADSAPEKPSQIESQSVPELAEKKPKVDQEAINLEKTQKKQKEALAKLKTLSALQELENQLQKDNKKNGKQNTQVVRGNALSAGTSLTGLNKLQHENYQSTLDRHVKQYWQLPEWLSKKNYKARIRIRIDERGNLIDHSIILSSGNSAYDDAVVETIKQSSPFPAPPDKFINIVRIDGIVLGFPD